RISMTIFAWPPAPSPRARTRLGIDKPLRQHVLVQSYGRQHLDDPLGRPSVAVRVLEPNEALPELRGGSPPDRFADGGTLRLDVDHVRPADAPVLAAPDVHDRELERRRLQN